MSQALKNLQNNFSWMLSYMYKNKSKNKNKQKLGITSEEVMGTRKIRKSKWDEPEKKQDRRGVRKC